MQQEQMFNRYNGALLYNGLPHSYFKCNEKCLLNQIILTKSLFARYYTDSQLITPPPLSHSVTQRKPSHLKVTTQESSAIQNDKVQYKNDTKSDNKCINEWWHCVKTAPVYIEKLTAKQRYRVNKGLKLNDIHIASTEEIESNINEIEEMLQLSYSDFPKIYKPTVKQIHSYVVDLIDLSKSNTDDVWLVYDKATHSIIGMSHCKIDQDVVLLISVKVCPDYLKNEVNAALVYEICHYYLNECGMRYISDGERNIRHITNYQDFLVRVLGFEKAYCSLHVVYHPLIRPIVNLLYPFRKLISKAEKINKYAYNLSCLLKQEEIARKYRY